MAQIVAPDVCRYAFNGTYQGRPCVNILDMVLLQNTLEPDTRAVQCRDTANVLLDQWVEHVLGNLSTSYTLDSVSWIDLDSEDGPVGSLTATDSHTLPLAGGAAGQPYGANSAVLVTKEIDGARGKRTGRWFLPAVTEANAEGNFISNATLTDFQSTLSDFIEGITETGVIEVDQYFPTVVHTKNVGTPDDPIIEYQGNSQVRNFAAQARIASQRRRNRP